MELRTCTPNRTSFTVFMHTASRLGDHGIGGYNARHARISHQPGPATRPQASGAARAVQAAQAD
eukprot:scaffold11980_cov98-Isochrysis_galbana.AAC.5